jgi:dTDP-4-dehydrorhamnose reductase
MPARIAEMPGAGGPTVVLGASGLLGGALIRCLQRRGVRCVAATRRRVDLARPEGIAPALADLDPGTVINAAAFTAVDLAEDPQRRREVFLVNREGPAAVARLCAARRIPMVHLSTDYVFDGSKRVPYDEDDAPRPLQVYGTSKLEGERAVREAHPAALVVRTSTLFGDGRTARPHYVEAVLRQSLQRRVLEVVEGPVSSPTYAPDLAAAILKLLERGARGVVHVVNGGGCSRLELARATLDLAGREAVEIRTRHAPPSAVFRPDYSVLGTSRFHSVTGTAMRPWREALAIYLRDTRAGDARRAGVDGDDPR